MGRFTVISDICDARTEVLVNSANAQGWMGGILSRVFNLTGVSQSLNKRTKGALEKLMRAESNKIKPSVGDVFITSSVEPLNVKSVYHAVTMDKPGSKSDLVTIDACYRNIVDLCYERGEQSVTVPLLGCGTGGLEVKDVLEVLYKNFLITELDVVIAHPDLIVYD